MGLFIRSMGTPVCKDIKIAMGEVHFRSIFLGGFGAWMTFKKAEIEKILRNGLNMSETDPLNYKRLDFTI